MKQITNGKSKGVGRVFTCEGKYMNKRNIYLSYLSYLRLFKDFNLGVTVMARYPDTHSHLSYFLNMRFFLNRTNHAWYCLEKAASLKPYMFMVLGIFSIFWVFFYFNYRKCHVNKLFLNNKNSSYCDICIKKQCFLKKANALVVAIFELIQLVVLATNIIWTGFGCDWYAMGILFAIGTLWAYYWQGMGLLWTHYGQCWPPLWAYKYTNSPFRGSNGTLKGGWWPPAFHRS